MFDWFSLTLLAALFAAILLGGMVFFAAVFTPLVFRKLPSEIAGPFLRQVFPVYYLAGMILGGLAAAFALASQPVEGAILTLVALGFLYVRQWLLPRIGYARDREASGDLVAGPEFTRLHRLSVLINVVQMAALTIVLIGLMQAV